jgi:hypothetical protein
VLAIVVGSASGCTGGGATPSVSPSGSDAPQAVDPGAAAFTGGTAPAPEATITPPPGSWSQASAPTGTRAVVLAMAGDTDGEAVIAGARQWADAAGAVLDAVLVDGADDLDAAVADAAGAGPDIVIGAGPGVVDVLSLATPQFLDQQFLVVGAQLAEPTGNVTAVIWPGAGFRGTGISADGTDVTGSITPDRVEAALGAGLASIHWDLTGIVIQLP